MSIVVKDVYINDKLNNVYSQISRSETFLNSKLSNELDSYLSDNTLSFYLCTIEVPFYERNPWKLAQIYQDKLISKTNELAEHVHIVTCCIDFYQPKKLNLKFSKLKEWTTLCTSISEDYYYDTINFPSNHLDIIINFWMCLKYQFSNDKKFINYIDNMITLYNEKESLLGDNIILMNKPEDEGPLSFIEETVKRIEARYNIPLEYEAGCICQAYGKPLCNDCKSKPTTFKCINCGNNHAAKHEKLCLNCYIDEELSIEKNKKKNKNKNKYIPYRIEKWITMSHTPSGIGYPIINLTIIKNQQKNPTKINNIITENIHNIVGKCTIQKHSINKSKNPIITAIMFTWKNINHEYIIHSLNKGKDKKDWNPACRTVFTSDGMNAYYIFKKILNEFKNSNTEYNPYITLEILSQQLNSEIVIKKNIPIEYNSRLQAIEVVAELMRKKLYYINRDGSIWEHKEGTKMTYKLLKDQVESFYNNLLLILDGENLRLVKQERESVIHAFKSPDVDTIIYSEIPRIKMTYRMIELADGYLDIINKCTYTSQNNHPCSVFWPDIKIATIYDDLSSKFLKKSIWYKTCISSSLWYIEYLADLYNQLLPTIIYKYILNHVGGNIDGLIFLLTPFLKLFPENMSCQIRTTINEAKQKQLQSILSPLLFPRSNMKLLQQNEELLDGNIPLLKCNGVHNSNISLKTDDNTTILKEHSYADNIIFESKSMMSVYKEIPYIIFYCALCSFAQENKLVSLYKLPHYSEISDYNNEKFKISADFLYEIEHEHSFPEEEELPKTNFAFSEDTIAWKHKTHYINKLNNINNIEELTDNIKYKDNSINTTQQVKKKRGRPPKVNLHVHIHPISHDPPKNN